MIAFDVPGEPVPYARSGARGGMRFTPAPQRNFMALVRMVAGERMKGVDLLTGPLHLSMCATYAYPASWSAKKRAASVWKTSRPDASNLLKIVEDDLNQVVWGDDTLVARLHVEKVYGGVAGLHVEVLCLDAAADLLSRAA